MRNALALLLLLQLACSDRSSERAAPTPAGSSEPRAEVIASDVQSPVALAVDDTWVYWGDGGALKRARKRGAGAPEEVCRIEAVRIESIALAPDAIYVGASGGGIFRRRNQAGATCERIMTETDPSSLAVVGDQLHYWNGGAPHRIPRDRPADAQAPTSWQVGYTGALVTDGKNVFVHQLEEIARIDLDGGGFTPLARTGHLNVAMAVDDTHVYWGDDLTEAVLRVPKAGGPPEWFSPVWGIGSNLAVDREWIYVMDIDGDVTAIAKQDGRSARVLSGNFTGTGTNHVALAFDADQFFLADDSSTFRTGGAPAVIDLTGKGGGDLPDVRWEGHVARAPRRLTGLTFEPRPATVEASTVYFDSGSDEAQDWNNATGFTRWRDERLSEAVRAGKLTVGLNAGAPDGDQARARRRAEAVAERIRAQLGNEVAFEIRPHAGGSNTVVVEFEPSAYAAVWAP